MTDAKARYKYDMKPEEVLAAQTSASTPSTAAKGCFSGNIVVCDDDFICQKATSKHSGSRKWETTRTWDSYVQEAKRRGLSCGVSEARKQHAATRQTVIPAEFDQFRKVTFKLATGDKKTMGAGRVEKISEGFSTDGRVILNGVLCVTSSNFNTESKEGSFKIDCPDGYSIKGGYVPLGANNGSIGRGYDSDGNPVEYRLHSNSGSNFVSKLDFINFHNDATKPSTTSTSKLDKAKSTCKDIGFTAGTEKFGECVLKMMDK